MQDIRKIIGKTVSEVVTDYAGKNSYLTLKFKEGGKANFVAFDPQKKGSVRVILTLDGKEINQEPNVLVGKQIQTIKEEFTGDMSKFVLKLSGNAILTVEAMGAEETTAANVELVLYESLRENQYLRRGEYTMNQPQYEEADEIEEDEEVEEENNNEGMATKIYLVEESLSEFARRGRKPKTRLRGIDAPDAWGGDDDEFDAEATGPEEIEDVEVEDEVGNFTQEIARALDNQLKIPEFSRNYAKFRILGTGEMIKGVPMAKLAGGTAYLFKTQRGEMKKIKVTDMIFENVNEAMTFAPESSFTDYVFEIGDYIRAEVPDWDILTGTEHDIVDWLEENSQKLNIEEHYMNGTPAEEVAVEIEQFLMYSETDESLEEYEN